MTTLHDLNTADEAGFVALLSGIYEHSPWIAQRAWVQRPFITLAQLKLALVHAVRHATHAEQLGLIRAHPELAGKAAVAGTLTAESTNEQSRAGLTHCTPDEFAKLQRLNADYQQRFGWPFILAVRGPRVKGDAGLTRTQIIEAFERRLHAPPAVEFAECLRNIHRIAEIRLNERFGLEPTLGRQVWDWAEALAAHSEPGYAEQGQLTVTYLTEAHQACARQLAQWVSECGFDEVEQDAVGNVVARYHGAAHLAGDANAKTLLTGSHFDTVRNAGKYDGRLGILAAMAAVRRLAESQIRPRFSIELVAFAEEEGQRYAATFLGSSALAGQFDAAWLDQTDANGVTMRGAMQAAGLPGTLDAIAALKRDAARYLGYVEVHIEQGPVLAEMDLPLGIVSAINGSVRYSGEIVGLASHAGTTPMGRRFDAACAAAELALYVEKRAAQETGTVGTMGILQVPSGSINVVPGRCQFTLDLRAPANEQRDRLAADVRAELAAIAERRGVQAHLSETMRASAAPCAYTLERHWGQVLSDLGLPVFQLPSGAGHDAMKIHELMPQAMLFVRGCNLGISHNPLEAVTDDDAELAVQAFLRYLDALDEQE